MTRSAALVALLGITAAAGLTRAALRADAGLRAEYIADAGAGGQRHTGIDREISTAAIARAWNGSPPAFFRVRWSGYLVVPSAGTYTFSTTSDDGSTVAIDGERVVDNSGDHGVVTKSGAIRLERGPHAVIVDYSQHDGLYALTWLWGREGSAVSPVPSWALWTRRASPARALALRAVEPLFLVALIVTVLFAAQVGWQARGRELVARTRSRWHERDARAASPPDPARARWILRIALPVASLVVALLVAEGVARLVFRAVRSAGDARTFFAGRGEASRINNLGYRDAEVGAKAGRFRVIVIGDSITWGVGLSEDERFSNLLQRFLGSSFEVLNFGIPGHNMPEHLDELTQALTLAPDFILLQVYTNDFETADMERPRARPLLPWRPVDRWLLQSSAVYTMLSAQWPRVQEKLGMVETYEHYMYRHLGDPQSAESQLGFGQLHTFFRRAREANVPAGAVMFPNPEILAKGYQYGYLHDRVQEVCAAEHVRCVDLRGPFTASFTNISEIVVSPFDGHPSPRASLVAADQILAEFRPMWRPCSMRVGDPSCEGSHARTAEPTPPSMKEKPAKLPRRAVRRKRAGPATQG